MKKAILLSLFAFALADCHKKHGEEPPVVCTQEFRKITLMFGFELYPIIPLRLDSMYTIRLSTAERIQSQQPTAAQGVYVVLDDAYQPRLKGAEDSFRFVGWRNGRIALDQPYRIAADQCHIFKRTGLDSLIIR